MSDVKWIKIATEIFDNRKIKQIEKLPDGDAIIVIWFKLLCLSGNVNDGGFVYFTKDIPYTEEMLSVEFNRPINTIRLALHTFQQYKMIDMIDNLLYVSSWEKYQNVDGMDKIREQTRQRVSKFRQNKEQKLKELGCNVTSNATVTHCNETDIDIELDIELNNKKHIVAKNPAPSKNEKNIIPPTLEMISKYCQERNSIVNPETFFDWNESKGWTIGKNKMKDWQAAIRTWEKREQENKQENRQESKNNKQGQKPKAWSVQGNDYDMSELEKDLLAN